MRFDVFEYMRFAKGIPAGARLSLTASGLSPAPIEWLGDPRGWVDLTEPSGAPNRALRERIAARYGMHPDHVFVTPGASGAIHLVAGVLGGPGTRAAVESPAYPPLDLEPRFFGGETRRFERRLEDRFGIDPARVSAALGSNATSLWVTTLHNPSGVALTEKDLTSLAELASRGDARLVSIELYLDYLGASRPRAAAAIAPGAITIGSMTKAFGLGALRIGWILCSDRELVRRVDEMFDHLDVACATPSLRAAAAALDGISRFEQRAVDTSARGLAVFGEWATAEEARGRVRAVRPDGGIVAFPHLEGVKDTVAFARELRAKEGVQVVPGEFFGAPGH
ncbi:MAG TPA: pyridoxal phosphate-dependent aminotransferase, partial [Planctomycetota bacterium]|nr:pyridoxal phosphate-dependent aminotransferase [Planctomycetota bacterium]